VEPVEQGGTTGPEGRVAGAQHRGTPAQEAAEQSSTEQRSKEAGGQGGREAPPHRVGREGGRPEVPPCQVEQGGRTVGGPEGQVGWWSRPAARHRSTAGDR
jgi:hypothetical protein